MSAAAVVLLYIVTLTTCTARLLVRDKDCGISIGCYHHCQSGICDFLVTWRHLPEIQCVEISMMKTLGSDRKAKWFAMGLSRDIEMGDDSVMECVMNEHMNFADVVNSYNVENYNINIFSGKLGLYQTVGGVEDGILSCNFTRKIMVPEEERIFSLDTPYYVFIASGDIRDGIKLRHSLATLPLVSPAPLDLRQTDDVDGSAKHVLVKVHGCLMLYAWIFAASIAVVLARYFKPIWPESTLCGHPIWFSVHRFLMITTFLTVASGFVVIFVDRKGFSFLSGHSNLQKAHPVIGVAVTCLTVLNPILACLRPKSGSLHRQVFKWSHTIIGVAVYILAVLNITIGVTLRRASAPAYLLWLLVGFAAYQLGVELSLEIHEWFLIKSGKMIEFEMNDTVGPTSSISGSSTDIHQPPGTVVKKTIMALHVLVSLGVTCTCIFILAMC